MDSAVSLSDSTASAVEGAVITSAPGSRSRRKRAHWAVACGWETTRVTSPNESGRAAITQWWMGWITSAAMRTPVASMASVSSVAGHRALQRVLDRHHRPVDRALLHRHHRLVDRGVGHLLHPGRGRRPQCLLAVGARGAEEGDPHVSAAARAGGPVTAVAMASSSSGESGNSEAPSRTCLT